MAHTGSRPTSSIESSGSSSTFTSSGSTASTTSASGPSAPSAGGGGEARFDPSGLVFWTDMAILAVVGVILLLKLPNVAARFSRASGWTQGFWLYSKRTPNRSRSLSVSQQMSTNSSIEDLRYVPTGVSRNLLSEKGVRRSPPLHVSEWPSSAHPLAVWLRYPVLPGATVFQIGLILAYFGVLCYAAFYKSNPFTDPVRAGYIAMSQMPIVYAFASKNNILGTLIGVGYERLNYFHRWAGRFTVLAANVHAIGYMYAFTMNSLWNSRLNEPYIVWGIIALICMDILFFFSTSLWRALAYNFFLASHMIALLLILIATCMHQPVMIPYISAAAGVYGLDLCIRAAKSRVRVATIQAIPELGFTRVDVPQLNAGWRAGQHIRVRVLSSKMGWWGWTEMHPFTIANAADGPEGLILLCKKAGGWSRKLYELAGSSEHGEDGTIATRQVKVMLEGPYGGPGHSMYSSYSAALLVAGGSGITFPLSVVQELLRKDVEGNNRVEVIELVWSIPDPAMLGPMIPIFASLLEMNNLASFKISVHYTRAMCGEPLEAILPHGLTVSPGRPKLNAILERVIDTALGLKSDGRSSDSGVMVGVCGPVQLGQEVDRVVGNVDKYKRKAIGGVELHQEVFGW